MLSQKSGYEMVKFFFLLTFAAAIPAIISGGIAERAKFHPRALATVLMLVGFVFLSLLRRASPGTTTSACSPGWRPPSAPSSMISPASVVVHAMGGWIALPAVLLLGAPRGPLHQGGQIAAHPPSNIPFLALGAWILTVGWFGFNVMSGADPRQGERAGGPQLADGDGRRHLAAMVLGKNDPGFIHNGPLAGLVAVCAGSDLMHPVGRCSPA